MVHTGLSVLLRERMDLVNGLRVGLVSHAAAVTPDLTGCVDAMLAAGVQITALFGPEHGFAGVVADGAAVGDMVDPRTRLPVYSLYGETREPTPAMLASVDVMVVDFQDVGVRFYTYLSTLYYVLRAGGSHNIPVIVLDRPNPINGVAIEGPLIDPGLESFVGIVGSLPIRHGMTMGELARFLNAEYHLAAPLTVVEMQGWQRAMWFDQTGLPWVIPSPAMPTLSTATVYPGTCFFEGTNFSEGRGTSLPFEVVGAPTISGYALAARLNELGLPGVRFRPVNFHPSASKHAGVTCEGVQIHVLDREAFLPARTGLHIISACQSLAMNDFVFLNTSWEARPPQFDLLTGSSAIREGIAAQQSVGEITAAWEETQNRFRAMREPYLIYR